MKKRFTAIMLMVIICISIFPCTIHAASASFEDALGLLNAIGVVSQGKITTENADLPVSRLDFVMIVSQLLGVSEDSASDEEYFYDISEDHWGKKKLNAMVENNYISVGEHYFRPDDIITKAEAATILVTALGRKTEAGFLGGFPKGYISVANDLKLFRGVQSADKLTYRDVVTLLYNAATEEIAYVNGNKNGMVFEESPKTLLSLHHDVYFGEGIINAIDGLSLGNQTAGEGGVVIGDMHFDAEKWYYDYLGMRVKYFYKETDDEYRKVFYVINERKKLQESITISSNCYDGYRGNTIYYRESMDSVSTKRIDIFPGATVIINGEKANTDMTSALDMNNIYGTIRVVDTEQFDGAELIIIENYENHLVSHIDKTDKAVYSQNNTYGYLNLNESEGISVHFFNEDGTKADFDRISRGCLISAAVSSNGNFAIIRISNNTVTGVVSEKGTDDYGIPYFIIDEVLYNADNEFYIQKADSIILGANVNFSIDIIGNIAALSNLNVEGMQYAFLKDARISTYAKDRELNDERVVLKLYTSTGEHTSLACATKVNVDGQTYKNQEDVLDSLSSFGSVEPQGIRLSYDSEGYVKNIDTVKNPQTSKDFTLRKINTTDSVYYHWTGQLGNMAIISDDIPIMFVPQKGVVKDSDQKHFAIKNRSALGSSNTFTMDLLSSDPESVVPEFVICYKDVMEEASNQGSLFVVEKVKKKMNSDYEVGTCITLDSSGDLDYFISSDYKTKTIGTWNHVDPESLTAGDVVRFSTNMSGEIVDIRLIFDYSQAMSGANDTFFVNGLNPSYRQGENSMMSGNVGYVTSYGYISKKEGNAFAWGFNSPKEINQVYGTKMQSSSLKVMVFDSEKRQDKCTSGSIDDIISYEESPAKCSKVIIMQNDRVLRQMIIYK